jgi:OmpA-OmpF porin, OOP family
MANSMFESILGMVTPEMTQSMADQLGESPSAVQHGLGAATAATLNGLARNTGDTRFTDQLMQTVSRAGGQNIVGNIGSIASGGPAGGAGDLVGRFTSQIFGSQQGQIANLVAQHAGVSERSGSGILKVASGLVLAHLARMHSSGSLNAGTLAGTLRTEASSLGSYVPGSFLANLGGTARDTITRGETLERGETVERGPAYTSNVLHAEGPRLPPARGSRWVAPTLLALVVAAAIGWAIHRLVRNQAAPVTAANETVRDTGMAAATRVNLALPDGSQINVPANGVEVRMVRFLQAPSTQASGQSAATSFNFDRLMFNPGQPTLQPQSNEQLDNIAAILKAYPDAKCAVGGYADNTGDPSTNQKLSEERASNVMTALTQRGVDPGRLTAQGYGESNPTADNSTAQGRQMNRRVTIRVASK